MPDRKPEERAEIHADFGTAPRPTRETGLTAADIIAFALSLLWLAVFGGLFLFSADPAAGAMQTAMVLIAIVLPVALIWLAALTVRSTRSMRDEAQRLQVLLDSMRQAYLIQAQTGATRPSVEKRLEEIAAATRSTEQAVAMFASVRDAGATLTSADRRTVHLPPSAPVAATEQPGLALGTPAEALPQPLSLSDTVSALNFPDGADDADGFRALRMALADREMARMIRAAQDVLTLLSQDGIYMDDLRPDLPRPELWRRFAQGERGRSIAALGGVRDRSSLALSAARTKQDTIFRDAAHHFLRQFDRMLVEFEKAATDSDLAALAETRSARAFMLLGRVAGTFD
jgi:hypothetical protein